MTIADDSAVVLCRRVNSIRPFSRNEQTLIRLVAERLPPEAAEQLLSDVADASVHEEGDFVRVELRNYERPPYEGHSNLPFEGKLRDVIGEPVSALLNTQNGRLLEIEFIWWNSPSGTELDWSTLEIADSNRDRW